MQPSESDNEHLGSWLINGYLVKTGMSTILGECAFNFQGERLIVEPLCLVMFEYCVLNLTPLKWSNWWNCFTFTLGRLLDHAFKIRVFRMGRWLRATIHVRTLGHRGSFWSETQNLWRKETEKKPVWCIAHRWNAAVAFSVKQDLAHWSVGVGGIRAKWRVSFVCTVSWTVELWAGRIKSSFKVREIWQTVTNSIGF